MTIGMPGSGFDRATSATSMSAIVQDRYGLDPSVAMRLANVAIPKPRAGEVLLRVRAAGVDRGTWHVMTGRPYVIRTLGFGLRGPRTRVPGLDAAGEVVALGAGVTSLRIGQRVFGTVRTGALAEYAVARTDRISELPASIEFVKGAAVPVSGTTALIAVRDRGGLVAGQRVLVLGASGGVGTFAVQLAVDAGAEVTGVCRGQKMAFVAGLGATRVIDYQRGDLSEFGRFDLILDIGGGRPLRRLLPLLKDSGTLVIVGAEDAGLFLGGIDRNLRAALLSAFVGPRLTSFISRQRVADLETLADLIVAGRLRPSVYRVLPLQQAADAMSLLVSGSVEGKLVLTP